MKRPDYRLVETEYGWRLQGTNAAGHSVSAAFSPKAFIRRLNVDYDIVTFHMLQDEKIAKQCCIPFSRKDWLTEGQLYDILGDKNRLDNMTQDVIDYLLSQPLS